ncbi:hypothetical protein WA026_017614 [Henosepilachna vigintioctopunctata]|uniref:Uncharacterized protein n=1 Tax=Henosepilachna vigintioctopunctata TaxID=420089 RepID=A0AAW1V336_9CUCU
MVQDEKPLRCNINSRYHIDYGVPIVANKSTDYRTTTKISHDFVPENPDDFDCRIKVNLRDEWEYKDVALKDAAFETTHGKDFDTKYSQKKVLNFCVTPSLLKRWAPRGDKNYIRNLEEKMIAAPPKPMTPKISEMKDNFRMNYSQPQTRETLPPSMTAICPVQGLGRDEQPPIRPENKGFWKWLDPYLTTNRSTYIQFTPNQCKEAKKDFPTYYNTNGKWAGFSDVLPPASGNKSIVDPIPFKNQLPNRIVPPKVKRVPNFGITTEYSANYHINSRSDLSPYIQSPGEEFPESLSEASAWQNLAAPGMYCTEYCQIGTGTSSRNTIAVDTAKKNIVHSPCRIKFTDNYKYY